MLLGRCFAQLQVAERVNPVAAALLLLVHRAGQVSGVPVITRVRVVKERAEGLVLLLDRRLLGGHLIASTIDVELSQVQHRVLW